MRRPPDPRLARERYDELATGYEHQYQPDWIRVRHERLRRRAVTHLRLASGQTVLDVGCGTGLSLGLLAEAVGSQGQVIGIDQSAGMLAAAYRRIDQAEWPNVILIEQSGQDVAVPRLADAAVFFFTHDLLRSARALDNIVGAVRSGGRIVAVGMKRPRWWLSPLYPVLWLRVRRYLTTFEGAGQPWSLLAKRLDHLSVEEYLGGCSTWLPASAGSSVRREMDRLSS